MPHKKRKPAKKPPKNNPNDFLSKGLTLKQHKFAQNYLKNNGNATQAVLEAGYNTTDYASTRAVASENLSKPNVQKHITELIHEDMSRKDISNIHRKLLSSNNEGIQHKALALYFDVSDDRAAIKQDIEQTIKEDVIIDKLRQGRGLLTNLDTEPFEQTDES